MTIEIKTNQDASKYEEYSLCLYSYEYSKRVVVVLSKQYNEPQLFAYFKGAKIPYFTNRKDFFHTYTSSGDSFPQGSIHPRAREYVEQLLKDNPRRQFTFFTSNITLTSPPGLFSNQIVQVQPMTFPSNLTFYIPSIPISYNKKKKKRKKKNKKK